MADKDRSDPFPNLGGSAISRRFTAVEKSALRNIGEVTKRDIAARAEALHQARARETLAKAERDAAPLATPKPRKPKPAVDEAPKANKRGRPTKGDSEKPWIAEGISRMTWYRRQKAKSNEA